uniref:Uncharacterized protein n=1 Tax=Moniliophthora roreri TaxID=221103 RepID=A0A0W0EZY1_MONRR
MLHAFWLIPHIQRPFSNPHTVKEHPLDVFFKSPSLHVLLHYEPYHHAPVQWENLTHLDIATNYRCNPPTPTVVQILSRASLSLQECSIAITLTLEHMQWPSSVFPHLHTLHLQFILNWQTSLTPHLLSRLCAFGDSMVLTKLKHLMVEVAGTYRPQPLLSWPFPSLVGPGCELETLGFNINITREAIVAVLCDQPSITNLVIDPC